MKRKPFSKICIFSVTILLLVAALTGYSGQGDTSENLEKPAARVDNMKITLRELYSAYEVYEASLVAVGVAVPQTEEETDAALDQVLDNLIKERMEIYQAGKQGFSDFSEEESAVAEALFEMRKQQILTYFCQEAQSLASLAQGVDVDAYVEAAIGQMAIDSGLNVKSLEEYWTALREKTMQDYAVSRMKESAKAKLEPDEEKIRSVYDQILAENRARLKKGAGEYKSMEELYARYGGEPVLEVPEGYVRIHYIRTKTSEAAAEARKRLLANESFSQVCNDLSLDVDYLSYPVWLERGKPLSAFDSTLDWPKAVKDAVLALKSDGALTDVIETDNGYYVCRLIGAEKAGTVSFEEARESCAALAREELFEAYWESQLEKWARNILIVKKYGRNLKVLKEQYLY